MIRLCKTFWTNSSRARIDKRCYPGGNVNNSMLHLELPQVFRNVDYYLNEYLKDTDSESQREVSVVVNWETKNKLKQKRDWKWMPREVWRVGEGAMTLSVKYFEKMEKVNIQDEGRQVHFSVHCEFLVWIYNPFVSLQTLKKISLCVFLCHFSPPHFSLSLCFLTLCFSMHLSLTPLAFPSIQHSYLTCRQAETNAHTNMFQSDTSQTEQLWSILVLLCLITPDWFKQKIAS